jgi:hypothetical protein
MFRRDHALILRSEMSDVAVLMDGLTLFVCVGGLNFDVLVTERADWIASFRDVGHTSPPPGELLGYAGLLLQDVLY